VLGGLAETATVLLIEALYLGGSTPTEIAANLLPISTINVPYPISWADEERDLTAWLGNELQVDAFNKLYSLTDKVSRIHDEKIQKDWKYLQASDHLYFMSTKFFSDGATQAYFNPYDSPYEAYINYMNVLSDFTIRVNALVPESTGEQEIANLSQVIADKDALIGKYEAELKRLKSTKTKIETLAKGPGKTPVKKAPTKKAPAKKTPAKKIPAKSTTMSRKPASSKKVKTKKSKAGKK
jgi:alpha-amylase